MYFNSESKTVRQSIMAFYLVKVKEKLKKTFDVLFVILRAIFSIDFYTG